MTFSNSSLALFLVLTTIVHAEDRPVALVADKGYGLLEATALEQVVLPDLPNAVADKLTDFLEARDFAQYRMVIIAGALERTWTDEELREIEDYVRKGGKLVLIHDAPSQMAVRVGGKNLYPFGRSQYFREGEASHPCTINLPEDPLLANALESRQPFWLDANVFLNGEEWENLVGMEDYVLVGRRKLEQGEVYYLGNELFRVMKRGKEENKENETAQWIQILKNILSAK